MSDDVNEAKTKAKSSLDSIQVSPLDVRTGDADIANRIIMAAAPGSGVDPAILAVKFRLQSTTTLRQELAKARAEAERLRGCICAILEAVEERQSDAFTTALDDARAEVAMSALKEAERKERLECPLVAEEKFYNPQSKEGGA